MTYWRIDPKTRRLIVRDLTPSIRGLLASLSSTVANNAESISEQETLNFLTGRVIRSILFALWPLDWENADLWDIDWESWLGQAVMQSQYEANSILAANTSENPEALEIPEQTLVGRITDGDIDALTADEVKTLLAISFGGLYGINVETLAADKTLTSGTDKIYQYLDEGGANRIITLDTASATAGDRWVIRHNGVYSDTYYLQVKQAATELDKIYAGGIKEFIFDGTNWTAGEEGSGENDGKHNNISIGQSAKGYGGGVAVGYLARGETNGVAIGQGAYGYSSGVGVGYNAWGATYGVAIGYQAKTDDKGYSIALGYKSMCTRFGETSININGGDSDQENNVIQGRFERTTTNATPVEIFCAGWTNQRFLIRASSALAFSIKVVARDNVAGHVAMYTFEGIIKRDAANNTVLSIVNKVIIHEDDASWDVAVTADDTNEALVITVTGDATNATQWAAVMDGVETHF